MQYVGEMTAEIERMRGNAWLLCTSQQKTTLQRATTIPNSKKRLMNSCKCTMYLMPITLPSQPFKPCNLSMEESYIFFLSGKSFATYRILLSMCPPPKKCSPLDCEGSVVWGSSVQMSIVNELHTQQWALFSDEIQAPTPSKFAYTVYHLLSYLDTVLLVLFTSLCQHASTFHNLVTVESGV